MADLTPEDVRRLAASLSLPLTGDAAAALFDAEILLRTIPGLTLRSTRLTLAVLSEP
jgi:hypothetical protein